MIPEKFCRSNWHSTTASYMGFHENTGSPILCQCGKSILHMSNHEIFMIKITIKSYKTIKPPYKITIKPAFYPHHSWRRQSRTVDVAFDAPRAPSGPQAQQFYWGYSHPTMTHVDFPDVFLLDIPTPSCYVKFYPFS